MRSGIGVYLEEPRTDCTNKGLNNRSKDLVSMYLAPVRLPRLSKCRSVRPSRKCLTRPSLTHHRTCRVGRWCMPDKVPLCFSRPLCIRWTDFHLWKAQGANGKLANSCVLWQTSSRLLDDGVIGSSQQMDVRTLTHYCEVGFWQFGYSGASLQVTLKGTGGASSES